jgi:hypothetical protein
LFLVHSQYNVIMIVYIGEDSISWCNYLHSLRFHFLKWEVKYWSIEINRLCWETVHFLFQNIWYKQKRNGWHLLGGHRSYTLDIAIRKLDSLSKFKNAIRLNSQSNKISVPKLYYYGPRKLNVIGGGGGEGGTGGTNWGEVVKP